MENFSGQGNGGIYKKLFETVRLNEPIDDVYSDDERFESSRQKLRALETERKGRESYYSLRDNWSGFLRWLLATMVIFQFLITVTIGFGLMDFSEYRTFLYAILIENFLQIVGMVYIVVKFLFPLPGGEIEKIVLEPKEKVVFLPRSDPRLP